MAENESKFLDELIDKVRNIIERNEKEKDEWELNSLEFLKKYGHLEGSTGKK